MKPKGLNSLSEVHSSVELHKGSNPAKKLMAFIGPAYLVSVGYMDPGNWATDIAGGSSFGYSLIWVLLLSNLMALLLQTLSARFGVVTGTDLAQASRRYYSPVMNVFLYALAEIAITACDLAEVIGMAIGLNLLFGFPLIWGVLISLFDTFLVLFLMNRGIKKLEIFIVTMIFIIGFSFLIELLLSRPAGLPILQGFIPHSLNGESLYIAIGIIGATVMPHNLYLHSSLVQSRNIERSPKGIREALRYNLIDTGIALNIAFVVNMAILILAASAFYKNGYQHVAELQDAYKLLNRLLGSWAPKLFALALVASGQSSTVTGTLAGQIIMEGYLDIKLKPWLRRLITRLTAVIPALLCIIYFGDRGLGSLLVSSQVILSIQLGFAMIPLIHFTNSSFWMNEYRNTTVVKLLAWLSASMLIALNGKYILELTISWYTDHSLNSFYRFGIVVVALIMVSLLVYLIIEPFVKPRVHKQQAVLSEQENN